MKDITTSNWEERFDKEFSNDIFFGVATFFKDEKGNLDRIEGDKTVNSLKDFIKSLLAAHDQELKEKRDQVKQIIEENYAHDYDLCRSIGIIFVCVCGKEEKINKDLDEIFALLSPGEKGSK